MRPAILVALVMTAVALPGCGRAERPPAPPASHPVVVPETDTVLAEVLVTSDTMRVAIDSTVAETTVAVADTGQVPAPVPEPNDCRYTDARPRPAMGDAGYWEPYDSAAMARGVEHRCTLHPGGPEVRLVVLGEWSIPTAVDVFAPPDAARPAQRLRVDNDERAREGSTLVVGEDLNGDGWTDLRVRTFSGRGGVMYDVFRYLPARRAFVRDTVLSGESNVQRIAGQPCVHTSHTMVLGVWSSGEYCWRGDRWVLARTVEQDRMTRRGDDNLYIRTTRERRGGSLRIVRVDTLDDPNEGLYR